MILCADDFGISPGVSQGILELAQRKKITAVGCMVTEKSISAHASNLKPYQENVDVGLHLVLTDAPPLSPLGFESGMVDREGKLRTLPELLLRLVTGRVDRRACVQEIRAQVERFGELLGRLPRFVDGHRHVQQLPLVSGALEEALSSFQWQRPAYSRRFCLPVGGLLKLGLSFPWAAVHSGALMFFHRGWRRPAQRPSNRYLLGYSPAGYPLSFEEIFRSYLRLGPTAQDLFFCHPGHVDEALRRRDALLEHRQEVYDFLKSERAGELLSQEGVSLNVFEG